MLCRYPQGTGSIWLDDVECNSTDVFLANCSHRGFGIHNCVHSEDVAISCSQGILHIHCITTYTRYCVFTLHKSHNLAIFVVIVDSIENHCCILYTPGDHNDGNLRFVNDTRTFSTMGRLEIYLNGHWGTICSNRFGPDDATLACNQLGYRTYQRYGTVGQLG